MSTSPHKRDNSMIYYCRPPAPIKFLIKKLTSKHSGNTMVEQKTISISDEQLNIICPFYFMLDRKDNFLEAGKSFKKLFGFIKRGDEFATHFEIKNASENILSRPALQGLNIIQAKTGGIFIKCVNVPVGDDAFLFIGSPVMRDSATLAGYGLNIKDIASYDPLLDYLYLSESFKQSLAESEAYHTKLNSSNQALVESNEILNRALNISKMGSWSLNLGDSHSVFSEGCCKIYGLDVTNNKFTTDEWFNMLHLHDRAWVRELVQKSFESLSPVSFEARVLTPSGGVVHVQQNTIFNFDATGKPVSLFGLVMDITQQVMDAEELKNSENRLSELLENVQEAILVIDADWRVTYASKAIKSVFGYERRDIIGNKIRGLYHPDDEQLVRTLFAEINKGQEGVPVKKEVRVQHQDGRFLWAEITFNAQYQNGTIKGLVVTLHKIDSLVRAKKELEELNQNLEEKIQLKTRQLEIKNHDLEGFVYTISHDLRSPIRVVNSYASLLLAHAEKMDNADQCTNMLGIIKDYTLRMNEIISDLLNLSRLGSHELKRSETDLHALSHAVFTELTRTETNNRTKLIVNPIPKVFVDPGLMRQVLVNLIGNAIKYSGKVEAPEIKIGMVEDKEKGPVFYISDNGAGFPESFADKLFKPFQRGHSLEEFEGTGVGLSIVKTIINKHNGEIWASSKENEGATFYFTLPK